MTCWRAVLLCAGFVAAGCGQRDVPDAWDATAARAVARAEAALEPRTPLVALPLIGGSSGDELPWGVRQSLTTGGIELAAGPVPPGVRVLTFHDARRDGDAWIFRTSVQRDDGSATQRDWRVRCTPAGCTAVDES
jgi:hypothetical protein